MAAMSKGGLFLALVLMLAACAPHQSRVPRGAEDWPVNKRVQRLPPAQPLPPPKPQWVAREVTPDAVEVPAQTYVVRPGDTLRRISDRLGARSEEHTSELQSLMRISYAVFCLQKKKIHETTR